MPAEKRKAVAFIHEEFGISVNKGCLAIKLSRTTFNYIAKPRDDLPIITELFKLAEKYPRYGFEKFFALIRRAGHAWNHKRVYRVYKQLNLHLRRKGKKRLPSRSPIVLEKQLTTNKCWSLDFMSDALIHGARFRTLNIIDDCSREALAIEVDTTLPAARVIRVLERIAAWRGYPLKLRMDNGPEFISVKLANWAEQHGIELDFIQPGKPTQNSYIERFNRTFRDEVLNFYAFNRLSEVREIVENWMCQYNEQRPHQALGNLTPAEFALKHTELSHLVLH